MKGSGPKRWCHIGRHPTGIVLIIIILTGIPVQDFRARLNGMFIVIRLESTERFVQSTRGEFLQQLRRVFIIMRR